MEAGNILSADVLDIIFDTRNKDYGAYDLRKNYQRRLMKAMIITFLLGVFVCTAYMLFGSMKNDGVKMPEGCILTLLEVPPPAIKPDPPTPVLKTYDPPKIKMIDFVKPVIAPDEDVLDKPLATQDDMGDAKIGNADVDGKAYDGIQAPVEEAKGIVEGPKKQNTEDDRFVPIEKESEYPGGISAWAAFLNRHLIYPQDAIDNQVQGTVTVQFIVDGEGAVSNITAISGPEELRPAAIAVIKKSGAWTPALQNGRHVTSYKKQPITFKLVD